MKALANSEVAFRVIQVKMLYKAHPNEFMIKTGLTDVFKFWCVLKLHGNPKFHFYSFIYSTVLIILGLADTAERYLNPSWHEFHHKPYS